ncbi:MAG TPA: DNA internalization-related competence protein ComEC/Rec2 [Burkholderiaceae bacterium]|nr:DNA internalization-related competence protein ComEC/Rec2 [Burkholderiaceae bacterium]
MRLAGPVAFVAGVCLLQVQAALPGVGAIALLAGAAAAAVFAVVLRRRHLPPRVASVIACVAAAVAGFAYAAAMAAVRIADELPFSDEGVDVLVEGVVSSLPARLERGVRFEFDVEAVLSPDIRVPRRLLLGWYDVTETPRPAQRWRLTVRLKRPHGVHNPGVFDLEAWLLERNLRATGAVRASGASAAPQLVDPIVHRPGVLAERARHALRDRLAPMLEGRRYGGVLLALIVGDQRAIAAADWTLFNRTGIAHLVSISGLHITMIAGLAGWMVASVWRRTPLLVARAPVQTAGVSAGLAAAAGYALLAGWGVPAQRTVLMLAVVAVAWLARARVGLGHSLALAAAVVCLVDPWAVLAAGFWLSFGAVAAIVWVVHGRIDRDAVPVWLRALAAGTRVQIAVTLALMPATVVVFHQLSLISPLANAVAIPLVSWIVTPLALVGGALATLPGAFALTADALLAAAHAVFAVLAEALSRLAALPQAARAVATPPWPLTALSLAGIAWLLAPPGWPVRWLGAILAFPLFVWPAERPRTGEVWVTALDVGQGSALLLETRDRAWLYDTGPRYSSDSDAGERIVLPYLRHRGISHLDGLIVSHLDSDHSGGTAAVLRGMAVKRILSSVAASNPMFGGRPVQPCVAGERWSDGMLQFTLLHPRAEDYAHRRTANAMSCAVLAAFGGHRLLFTGDIGAAEEAALVARWPALRVDWLAVPHHGSRSSSSARLLAAVGAREAVAQAGYRNRYGHPDPTVAARYAEHGITLHRTDHAGALQWRFLPDGSTRRSAWRTESVRYWHNRPRPAATTEDDDDGDAAAPLAIEPFIAG